MLTDPLGCTRPQVATPPIELPVLGRVAAETNLMGVLGANARKHGLILRLIGNRVAFSPPQIISEDEIVELVRRLERALDDTWTTISAR